MVTSNPRNRENQPHHVAAMPASAGTGTSSTTSSNLVRRTAALVSVIALATSSSFPVNTSLVVGPTPVMAFTMDGRISARDRGRIGNHGISNGGGQQIGGTPFISQRFASTRRYGVVRDQLSKPSASSLSMIAKSGGKEIFTTEQFEADVLSPDLTERPVLVFYSAPWCGPCRLSNPVVKGVMKDFAERIDVVEVCTDDFAEIASEAGVVSIPTIQLFYAGELIDTIVGCVAKNVLSKAVTKILEESVGETLIEDEDGGEDDENKNGEEP
mmetsp:Transcript_10074/g.16655  ORF Transcript_10074/g.16655 Transcript_10074/m.16655 type:complete len:270 (-) Transcript_10074:36-845(-)